MYLACIALVSCYVGVAIVMVLGTCLSQPTDQATVNSPYSDMGQNASPLLMTAGRATSA